MFGIRTEDLLAVAKEFGIKKPERILEATREALDDWERYAENYDIEQKVRAAIRRELDARAEVLEGTRREMPPPGF